ncbi:hypothetical protein GCM10023151_08780 [Kangiella marina]|uniref:Uncharacterized protein n=1 Tax=Kangiella marina TaxID=1079178 RepID=A0ABP8IGZ3_9GAMM
MGFADLVQAFKDGYSVTFCVLRGDSRKMQFARYGGTISKALINQIIFKACPKQLSAKNYGTIGDFNECVVKM